MGDSDDDRNDEDNEKGWVKVEEYHPEKLKVFTPDQTIKIHPNDKAILEIQKGIIVNNCSYWL